MTAPATLLRGDEPLVPIVEAARQLGVRISPRGAIRWATHGVAGLRLASLKVGKARYTTVEALRAWIAAQQADPQPSDPVLGVAEADRVLESFGLGREG